MNLLALDTATEACSAAVWVDGAVLERHEWAPRRHAALILPMIEAVLAGTLVIDGIERPARQEPSSALEREPKITALPRQAGKSVFDAMALLSDGVSKHLSVGIDEAFRQRLNKKLGAIELNATLAQRQLKGRGENWARRALYSISLLRGELAALREDIKDVSNG